MFLIRFIEIFCARSVCPIQFLCNIVPAYKSPPMSRELFTEVHFANLGPECRRSSSRFGSQLGWRCILSKSLLIILNPSLSSNMILHLVPLLCSCATISSICTEQPCANILSQSDSVDSPETLIVHFRPFCKFEPTWDTADSNGWRIRDFFPNLFESYFPR